MHVKSGGTGLVVERTTSCVAGNVNSTVSPSLMISLAPLPCSGCTVQSGRRSAGTAAGLPSMQTDDQGRILCSHICCGWTMRNDLRPPCMQQRPRVRMQNICGRSILARFQQCRRCCCMRKTLTASQLPMPSRHWAWIDGLQLGVRLRAPAKSDHTGRMSAHAGR